LWSKFLAKKIYTRKIAIHEVHGCGPALILGYPITLGPNGNPSFSWTEIPFWGGQLAMPARRAHEEIWICDPNRSCCD
jgi:hypothetical protein